MNVDMVDTLHLALVQLHLAWENPIQNRAILGAKIRAITKAVDLILLPELCTTGFTMYTKGLAESMDGETMQWLTALAHEKQCVIAGSVMINEEDKYYNRFVFMKPDGTYDTYDKHHLFTLAKEQEVFTAGTTQVVCTYKGWHLKPQICYDLRFPVWARNTENYDVLLYVASWPKLRIAAWDALLKARAIENMSYCIGVNRVGLDGMGYEYNGHSNAYDVFGNTLIPEETPTQETIRYATLQKSHIITARKKFQFLEDRDAFQWV